MPPNAEANVHPVSTLGIKPPKRRQLFLSVFDWLDDKKLNDGAEGLWRIHDGLYDLNDFIKQHPGGEDWLKMTKGTDITEAFEVHHISTGPESMLPKFFKRKAATKRNAPFTFKEDGFYRTMKGRVREIYPTLPKQPARNSEFFIDTMCLGAFFFGILGVMYWNYLLVFIAGCLLGWTVIASHNFLHRRDNFRMYYFNLCGMDYNQYRVSHALSHHLHTNTIDDIEIINFEPILHYMPIKKSTWAKYGPLIYTPIFFAIQFHIMSYLKTLARISKREFVAADLIPLTIPVVMLIFGGRSLYETLIMWTIMYFIASFIFYTLGQNAGHHHPDIFHDGDTPRNAKEVDWGIAELDSVVDRKEITGSHWLVLTTFGDHALHHFFPTLDHAHLELLYPILQETMKEFKVNLRFTSQLTLISGGFRQLIKEEPNPNPPDLFKELK